MHIRFTTLMKIANWYGLTNDKKFVPLAELCQKEGNGDYLLPITSNQTLLQTSVCTVGTSYKVTAASPSRGLRVTATLDYSGLLNYSAENTIDISRIGEAPKQEEEPRYQSNVTPPADQKPVEMTVVSVTELDLFPQVEGFLNSAGPPVAKAS